MIGKKDIVQLKVKEMVAHYSHHLICLHVMHVQNVQVVKTIVKGLTYFKSKINNVIENADFLKLHHSHEVIKLTDERTNTL